MQSNHSGADSPLALFARMPAVDVSDIPQTAWDGIVGMQNEKDTVVKRIVLPLMHHDLAEKHGISIPKALLLFGPPGTGKTSFAQGISGRLGWKFIEISPSALGTTYEKEAHELKVIFDLLGESERVVVFIDEFEGLVLRPDQAGKEEKLTSNEFLRQMPKLRGENRILLVCATNNIRMLNPALLRPGRFDLIFPVGPLDMESRKTVLENKFKSLVTGHLDIDAIAAAMDGFTPADIEAVVASVAYRAFEREMSSGEEYRSTNDDFLDVTRAYQPTISADDMAAFREDAQEYCRAEYCHLF